MAPATIEEMDEAVGSGRAEDDERIQREWHEGAQNECGIDTNVLVRLFVR